MAAKDKNTKKTVAKATVKPVKIMVSEDALPAIDIAKIYNISTFDFFVLKKEAGIEDNTLLTMPEFRKKYQKIIRR